MFMTAKGLLYLIVGLSVLVGGPAVLVFLVTMPFVRFWHALLISLITSGAGWVSAMLTVGAVAAFHDRREAAGAALAIGSLFSLLALFVTDRTIWRRGRRSQKTRVAVEDFS